MDRETMRKYSSALLDPFVCRRGEVSSEVNSLARCALVDMLVLLEDADPPPLESKWGRDWGQFEALAKIYMAILRDEYCEACNEVYDYVCEYFERRALDELVVLLEQLEDGKIGD